MIKIWEGENVGQNILLGILIVVVAVLLLLMASELHQQRVLVKALKNDTELLSYLAEHRRFENIELRDQIWSLKEQLQKDQP